MSGSALPKAICNEIASQFRTKGSLISLGQTYVSGKAIVVLVEELLSSSHVRLSDGGEAWSELVSSGFAQPEPTSSDRERIERLCAGHGLKWNNKAREIEILVPKAEAANAVLRITSAAAGLDAWRAWFPEQSKRTIKARVLVVEMERLAQEGGWAMSELTHIQGSKHRWPVNAQLTRRRDAAAVMLNAETSSERTVQQAVAWSYDVASSGLVMVLSEPIANALKDSSELPPLVRTVPRGRGKETATKVMRAAEEVAHSAA
jgi:hypothetical protein